MSPVDVFMFFFFGSIVLGCFAAGIAYCRYAFRVQADATALARERIDAQVALKRELIQRGLPPQELEQAIKLLKLDEPPDETPQAAGKRRRGELTDQDLVGEMISHLAALDGISPQDLEQVIGLVRAADYDTKGAALNLVAVLAQSAEAEIVLAAVRSLCRPADKPRLEVKSLELSEHITR
jgi:hypothetical protein